MPNPLRSMQRLVSVPYAPFFRQSNCLPWLSNLYVPFYGERDNTWFALEKWPSLGFPMQSKPNYVASNVEFLFNWCLYLVPRVGMVSAMHLRRQDGAPPTAERGAPLSATIPCRRLCRPSLRRPGAIDALSLTDISTWSLCVIMPNTFHLLLSCDRSGV